MKTYWPKGYYQSKEHERELVATYDPHSSLESAFHQFEVWMDDNGFDLIDGQIDICEDGKIVETKEIQFRELRPATTDRAPVYDILGGNRTIVSFIQDKRDKDASVYRMSIGEFVDGSLLDPNSELYRWYCHLTFRDSHTVLKFIEILQRLHYQMREDGL